MSISGANCYMITSDDLTTAWKQNDRLSAAGRLQLTLTNLNGRVEKQQLDR
jgi:hypothetical protein